MIFTVCRYCNNEFHSFRVNDTCPHCGQKTSLHQPVWPWLLVAVAMAVLILLGLKNG